MFRFAARLLVAALAPLCVPALAAAQIDARMFRQPDVSATHIAFVYAGDIWVVPKTGGLATRLTSAPGEELFPRFSPDGSQLAFSANYDGNLDVYVVASLGGDPVRLTHHPMDDHVLDWHPDGKRVLFTSSRESGRQRFDQFYLVASTGGMPEKLPVPYGEFASFSPTAMKWRTCRRRSRTGHGSAIAAAGRRISGASICRHSPRPISRRTSPTMNSRCGTGTRSISCPIAAATSARTSGRST